MTRKRVQAIDFKAGKPTRWQAFDTFSFEVAKDASERRMTREGFMVVPAFIARTGIQEYGAMELGIEGTNRTVRLYRPPEEVFDAESYSTFERQTLTQNHPEGDVTAGNYRSVTVGDVHDVAPAGDGVNLGANLYFKAADAIEMVAIYGKNQLSCGYSFGLDMTPGTTPGGEAYDGVMRDIVGNHVALVWNARGGPGLRVADENNPNKRSDMKLLINGHNYEITDATLPIVEREIKALTEARDAALRGKEDAETKVKAGEVALKAATDAAAQAKTAAEKELADAKALIVSDEKIAELAEERSKVVADAKEILGEDFDDSGKGVNAIRVEALQHIVGAKDASPAQAGVKATLAAAGVTDLAKAKPEIAKIAFDGAVGVLASLGGNGRDGRSSATDSAEAFAPVKKVGARDGGGEGSARTIKYRTEKLGFGRPSGQA